jgi:hypothetical protein
MGAEERGKGMSDRDSAQLTSPQHPSTSAPVHESSSGSRWSRFGNLCLLELPDGTVYEFDFSCG